MDAHGGTIRAASAGPGHGATFTLELAATAPVKTRKAGPRAEHHDEPAQAGVRVLLVEDHPSLLRAMTRLIQDLGYAVEAASTVKAALELAQHESFDLLISDLRLPDGSGHDLMRALKRHSNLTGIVLSGYGMEEDIRRSKEAGFVEHLTKPVDVDTLAAAIQRALRRE